MLCGVFCLPESTAGVAVHALEAAGFATEHISSNIGRIASDVDVVALPSQNYVLLPGDPQFSFTETLLVMDVAAWAARILEDRILPPHMLCESIEQRDSISRRST